MSVFGVILVRIFPAFSRIRTEYGLRIQSECGKMREKCGPEQLRIRALFTQCNFSFLINIMIYILYWFAQIYWLATVYYQLCSSYYLSLIEILLFSRKYSQRGKLCERNNSDRFLQLEWVSFRFWWNRGFYVERMTDEFFLLSRVLF